jgi:restriction system protein
MQLALPNKDNLHLPLLKVISNAKEGSMIAREAVLKVKGFYPEITPEDMASTLDSGGNRLNNRIRWAKQDLVLSGDIDDSAGWGTWRITNKGVQRLKREWAGWKPQYVAKEPQPKSDQVSQLIHADPVETMEQARRDLVKKVEVEVLQRLRGIDSGTFETVVAQLLERLGYGNLNDGTIRVLGRSGDGGIDGECSLDKLGLYKAKFQAKKWKPGHTVSSKEVRDFVGALTTERIEQGIFVTTSDFSSDAKQTALKSGKVKLINGEEFARIAVETGLGVRKKILDFPTLDEDYFSGLD